MPCDSTAILISSTKRQQFFASLAGEHDLCRASRILFRGQIVAADSGKASASVEPSVASHY